MHGLEDHRDLAYYLDRLRVHLTRCIPVKPYFSNLVRPIASFTFDDFPRSSWLNGGPVLARYVAPATFYVVGRWCNKVQNELEYYREEDLAAIHAVGNEIGQHTFEHIAVPKFSSNYLRKDTERNSEFLYKLIGKSARTSFAYPFGQASIRTKRLFSGMFRCCRGSEEGLNRGWVDLSQLKVTNLGLRQFNEGAIKQRIAEASRTAAWIIFVAHDVDEEPSSFGTTPEILAQTLAWTSEAGIEILTIEHALLQVTKK